VTFLSSAKGILPWLAVVVALSSTSTGCFFLLGKKYKYEGRAYKMTANQIEYHQKALEDVKKKKRRAADKGASDLEVARIECDAFREHLNNVEQNMSGFDSAFQTATEPLKWDEQQACYRIGKLEKEAEAKERAEARHKIDERTRKEFEAAQMREAKRVAEAIKEELVSGKCDAKNHALLQKIHLGIRQRMNMMERGRFWQLLSTEAHDFVVATEEGAELAYSSISGGEMHLLVVGFLPLEIEVLDGDGQPMAVKSTLGEYFHDLTPTQDSRVALMDGGDELSITVRGRGCVLLLVIEKLGGH